MQPDEILNKSSQSDKKSKENLLIGILIAIIPILGICLISAIHVINSDPQNDLHRLEDQIAQRKIKLLREQRLESASIRPPELDLGPYMSEVQRRIKKKWFPPKGGESLRVSVIFNIDKNGKLSKLRLQKEAPEDNALATLANQSALKAVQDASPFNPLPEGSPKDVDIQFTFDYHVFTGKSRQF